MRRRAAVTLLRSLKRGPTLGGTKDALRALTGTDTAVAPSELASSIERLLAELSAGAPGRFRCFDVLRRSDVEREAHAAIATDVGISRSQFYRDLREARELFAEALEERLLARTASAVDLRFFAIEALRDNGQYSRAIAMAGVLARSGDAADAARALCLRAELEIETGAFVAARKTAVQATLVACDAGEHLRESVGAECELVEFEARYCLGTPESTERRRATIARLRRRVERGDVAVAALLVKALIQETSIEFGQGRVSAAQAAVDEAECLGHRFPLTDRRLAIDVRVRATGLKALQADHVSAALEDARAIVADAARQSDARGLRLGLQATSSHLLTLGRADEAKQQALQALALIDLFGSELDRLVVLSSLARIDLYRGDATGALQWVAQADRSDCQAFSVRQALAVSRAEAFVLTGQPRPAIRLARAVQARSQRWPRVVGRAQLAEAMAWSRLARQAEARRCSERAIELSRDAGPLFELHALDFNVRLTGDPRSQRSLRALQAALHGAAATARRTITTS